MGFLPVLVGALSYLFGRLRFYAPVRKNEKIQGKRGKHGRTESNVSRKAKTWIPSPFCAHKRLCRFHDDLH